MKEKLGTNTTYIEKRLREDKKKLKWDEKTLEHHWNSEEAREASVLAKNKQHRWNSEEAKLAAKKRWSH